MRGDMDDCADGRVPVAQDIGHLRRQQWGKRAQAVVFVATDNLSHVALIGPHGAGCADSGQLWQGVRIEAHGEGTAA